MHLLEVVLVLLAVFCMAFLLWSRWIWNYHLKTAMNAWRARPSKVAGPTIEGNEKPEAVSSDRPR